MNLKPIKTKRDYQQALERLEVIFDAKRGTSAPNQMPLQALPQVYVPNSLDLRLKENVQQQLRTSIRNFDPNRVIVLSQNGEITLEGVVKSPEESNEIEKSVQISRLPRVTKVTLCDMLNPFPSVYVCRDNRTTECLTL